MQNTFVIPVVRDDLLDRCLETLYERTPDGFYVFVVDQTLHGVDSERLRERYENLLILRTPRTATHPTGNLGFAKAVNVGLALVDTPYATVCNDDVEFIDPDWWAGVLRTFDRVESARPRVPAVIVNPISVKLPHWAIGRPAGEDHYVLPYRERWSAEDWDFLVEKPHRVHERLTIRPHSFADGVEMFCSVMRTDRLRTVGPLNERFYPGGGEDYDYTRRARVHGFSCVSTTESWVFHHWGRSRGLPRRLLVGPESRLVWNDLRSLWGPVDTASCRPDEMPPTTVRPL